MISFMNQLWKKNFIFIILANVKFTKKSKYLNGLINIEKKIILNQNDI